jgi:hypothetical protein
VDEDSEMQNSDAQATSNPIMSASNPSSETLVDREEVRGGNAASEAKTQHVANGHEPLVIISHDKSEDIDMGDPSRDSSMFDTPSAVPNVIDLTNSDEDLGNSDKIASDVRMADVEEPQTVDQKVLTALEHQKRSSGTDQQDVEEVMGSIINRLQAAIRPSSVDKKTGIQLEKIMETFFVTTVNYTKKFHEKARLSLQPRALARSTTLLAATLISRSSRRADYHDIPQSRRCLLFCMSSFKGRNQWEARMAIPWSFQRLCTWIGTWMRRTTRPLFANESRIGLSPIG